MLRNALILFGILYALASVGVPMLRSVELPGQNVMAAGAVAASEVE